jgi:hypothetical protein
MTTLWHTTLDRTPLDKWSARRRDLYLTTHNLHNRQTSMPRRNSNPQSHHSSSLRPTPFRRRGYWDRQTQLWMQILNHNSPITINTLNAELTLTPLTWRIWWAPNNASRWEMGFNSAFKGLNPFCHFLALLGAHPILHVSGVRVNKEPHFNNTFLDDVKKEIEIRTKFLSCGGNIMRIY